MYKIKDESIVGLEQAFNLLNELEVKGIQNHSLIASIATLLQKFRSEMEEVVEQVKTSNLPPTKKKKEEK